MTHSKMDDDPLVRKIYAGLHTELIKIHGKYEDERRYDQTEEARRILYEVTRDLNHAFKGAGMPGVPTFSATRTW